MMLFPQITCDEDIHLDGLDEPSPTLIPQGWSVLTDTQGKANPGNKDPPCLSEPILADTKVGQKPCFKNTFRQLGTLLHRQIWGITMKNE